MKPILLTFAATVLAAGPALAQTVVIQPEQETVIREYVTTHQVAPIEPPSDVQIVVGSTLPDTVELHAIQEPVLDRDYQYVVVGQRTVLVEPSTRKIIHIIE